MTFSVGEFRALRAVGASRSGRVWLAVAPQRPGPVVLRLHDPGDTARVEAEFRTASRGRHPHLLPVLAVATSAREVALVSEFAAGGSLRDRLAAGTLRPGQVVTLLAALSSALAYCHDTLASAHGDVRASRVLFAPDGRPLLAGLGAVGAALTAGDIPALRPGDVSPEVARGASPVPADDVFALGSVALQALSGRSAWPADELRDVVVQSGFGQWPGPDVSCPRRLAELLDAMLAQEPAERPTAGEIYRALADCDEPEPIDLPDAATSGSGTPDATETGPADAPRWEVGPAAESPHTVATPASPASPPRRRGRHEDDETHLAGEPQPAGRPSPNGWLDAPDAPSWSLTQDSGPAVEGDLPPLAVTPVASPVQADGIGRTRPNRRTVHRRPDRWRRTALTTVVALTLAVGSVIAGLWWASSDATPAALLPPVAGPSAGIAATALNPLGSGADETRTRPATSAGAVDWLAVVTELDARRSDAFAAADADLLAAVYAPGAEALAADAERIRTLSEAGLKVEGLRHAIASVRLVEGTALTVEVVDSMPPQPILDDTGTVVAHTSEQMPAARLMRLTATADGYRIADVLPAG